MNSALLLDDEPRYLARLTGPQSAFYLSKAKFPLFIGGFGSGKSTTMSTSAATDIINYPGANIACYAPTYDLLKLITEPFIAEALFAADLKFQFNKSDHIFTIKDHGMLICRSLSNPERIIGYEVFRSHVDELDTLRTESAENAWNKIIARNRQKIFVRDDRGAKVLKPDWKSLGPKEELYRTELNRVSAYTTPEGFKFAYKRWVKEGGPDYAIYKASTYSNPHLPEGYIQGLIDSYPEELIQAYLLGEFVNLTSGRVYKHFTREGNGCSTEVISGETLSIGVDFNVLHGAASVTVLRDGDPHVVDEITESYDTDATVSTILERYPGHPIVMFPDASGEQRTASNTTESDIRKLRDAGFKIKKNNKNPSIKNRVASMNGLICSSKGIRRLRVNVEKCPRTTEALEQQVYDANGMPDKSEGLDHIMDALGYRINYDFGLVRPKSTVTAIEGGF